MQLKSQLQEASKLINKSSPQNKEPTETPDLNIPTENSGCSSRQENVKILLLESKTSTLENQLMMLSSKMDSMQVMFSMCKQNIISAEIPVPQKANT